jgi:hypothetical protein
VRASADTHQAGLGSERNIQTVPAGSGPDVPHEFRARSTVGVPDTSYGMPVYLELSILRRPSGASTGSFAFADPCETGKQAGLSRRFQGESASPIA